MFLNSLAANFSKINQARYITQTISVLFLVVVIFGQVFANEKLSLLEAAKDGNQDQVALLISNGADVNQTDDSGYTPLMWAARYNYMEISRLLVSAGARIGIKNKNDLDAIQLAARYQSYKIARFLENSYSPNKEKLTNVSNEESYIPVGIYDKNQDGYLDPVEPGKQLPEYYKNTVMITLKKCDQGKKYKMLSAWWGFYKNKWRKTKKINDSILFSNRKGYSIEINLSPEYYKEVMFLGYRHKQGRMKFIKRIAGDTQSMYEFLCAVPEVTGKLSAIENKNDRKMIFGTAACQNRPDTRLAVALVGLRKNNWKNIRIHNKEHISAEYKDSQLHLKVVIKYFEDWKYGRIYLSSVTNNAILEIIEPELLEKSLYKKKKKLRRDIARSYKSFCRI